MSQPIVASRDCLRRPLPGATCTKCGSTTDVLHSPIYLRGVFCPDCCPVCAAPAKPAAQHA